MIKAIFFDFDGVIVESVDIKTGAFAKLFETEGKEVVKKVVDYHLKHAGVSRYDKFRYIYKEILKRPLDGDEFQKLCDRFECLVVDKVVDAPYVNGAKEFLNNSMRRYRCYIVSATPQKEIEGIVRKRGIDRFFKAIIGAPTKKADAVRETLHKDKIIGPEALYVGDAVSDYLAAKENSVHFVARINDNEAIFDGVDCAKIENLARLDALIDNIETR